MATTTTIAPTLSLPAGTSTFPNPAKSAGGYAVPVGDTSLSADFAQVPPTTTVTLALYQSTDGGATWTLINSAVYQGGAYTNRQGVSTTIRSINPYWQMGTAQVQLTASAPCTLKNVQLTTV